MYSTVAIVAGTNELMRRTFSHPEEIEYNHGEVYKAMSLAEKGIKTHYSMGKGDSVAVHIVTKQHMLEAEVVLKRDTIIIV
jgi:hypothetical protein